MAKANGGDREQYAEKSEIYKKQINILLMREKNLLSLIEKDSPGVPYKKLTLAEEMMNLSSLYLVLNNLSVVMLGGKNEDALNDGRKTLYRAIIYLEEIVTNYIDASFTDYADKLAEIAAFPAPQRYNLVRKMGLSIRLLMDAYGDNTKWKWSFVELEGHFAAVAKNIIDLKTAVKDGLDPHSPDYEVTVKHLRLVKQLLQQSADRYREKYELSTNRIDDFRAAINYLSALRRIHIMLGEREDAESIKRKIDIWKEKMEKDHKKTDNAKKTR